MKPIEYLEGSPCTHCQSTSTVSLIADKHPLSPWECLDCGAVFGDSRTSPGLLEFYAHGPKEKDSEDGDPMETICVRCRKDLSDWSEERTVTDRGQICDDCIEWHEIPHEE